MAGCLSNRRCEWSIGHSFPLPCAGNRTSEHFGTERRSTRTTAAHKQSPSHHGPYLANAICTQDAPVSVSSRPNLRPLSLTLKQLSTGPRRRSEC